ncbi:hypothetical protein Hte_000942 [Hypoxylon texense]
MSLADYQTISPNLFSDSNTESQNAAVEQTAAIADLNGLETRPPPQKGFADIVEYREDTIHGREVEIIPIERFAARIQRNNPKKPPKYEDYAVVLRRTWVLRENVSVPVRVELEIHSEQLCRAFRKIAINTYETTDLQAFPIKLISPFSELFFYRDQIKSLAEDETNDPELRREAKVLHDFTQGNGLMSSIFLDHEKYAKEGKVASDILWTIYPPNSLIVLNIGMIRECWICRNISVKHTGRAYSWEIIGFRIGFDGSTVGLVRQTFSIQSTRKQIRKISDLPIVPIKHCKDWVTLQGTLVARSAKLENMLGKDFSLFSSQTYTGIAFSHDFDKYTVDFNPQSYMKQVDERVVVDFQAFIDRNRSGLPPLEDFGNKLKSQVNEDKAKTKPRGIFTTQDIEPSRRLGQPEIDSGLDEDEEKGVILYPENNEDPMAFQVSGDSQEIRDSPKPNIGDLPSLSEAVEHIFNISKEHLRLLFPALVPGFGLEEKWWGWLLSDELRDVRWETALFNSLQLEDATKDFIRALVKGHKIKNTISYDVVPRKGQGLSFLLHGNPGVGKTLTTESVAEYLERPLYCVSGGELSTDLSILETRLDEIIELTRRWDAVSVIDEVDLLLCRKNSASIDRSAIAAVSIRKIEYFQGVLFLVTNRKADLDAAIQSKIQVTISYPDLTEKTRFDIWRNLIEANKSVVTDNSWTDDVFSLLGKLDLNGRIIRNILRTAVAYANADNSELGFRHVWAIIKAELKDDEALDMDTLAKREREKKEQTEDTLRRLRGVVEAL